MKIKRIALSLISCLALIASSIPSTAVFVSAEANTLTTPGVPKQVTIKGSPSDITAVFANGTDIEVTYDDESDSNIVSWTDAEGAKNTIQSVPTYADVFAGCHGSNTPVGTDDDPVEIVINGAKLNTVYGGGLHESTVNNVKITVKGDSDLKWVCGGGANCLVHCDQGACAEKGWKDNGADSATLVKKAEVNIEAGTVANDVYGGGEGYSKTDSTTVNIKGGTLSSVCAGGSNGVTSNSEVNIENGTIKWVYSVNRGTMGSSAVTVTGGEIENLYVGSAGSDYSSITGTVNAASVDIKGGTVKELHAGNSSNGKPLDVSQPNYSFSANPSSVEKYNADIEENKDKENAYYYFNAYLNNDEKDNLGNSAASKVTPIIQIMQGSNGKTYQAVFAMANGTKVVATDVKNADGTWKETKLACGDDGSYILTNYDIVHLFGGSHNSDTLVPSTDVTLDGTTHVQSVWGGGWHKSQTGTAKVTVKGNAEVKGIQGGAANFFLGTNCGTQDCTGYNGSNSSKPCIEKPAQDTPEAYNVAGNARVDSATVVVESCKPYTTPSGVEQDTLIFGGGECYAYTGTVNVTVSGGEFTKDSIVYPAGSNGYTGKSSLVVDGEVTIPNVASGKSGIVKSADIEIKNGTVENLTVGMIKSKEGYGEIEASDVKVSSGGTVGNVTFGHKDASGEIDPDSDDTFKIEANGGNIEKFGGESVGYGSKDVVCNHNAYLPHLMEVEEIPATCVPGKYAYWKCANCLHYYATIKGTLTDVTAQDEGGNFLDKVDEDKIKIEATASHKYVEHQILACDGDSVAATYYTCETCTNYFEKEEGPVETYKQVTFEEIQEKMATAGHTTEKVPGKAATCSEVGYTDGLRCQKCGITIVERQKINRDNTNHVDAEGNSTWGDAVRVPDDDDHANIYPGLTDCTKGGWKVRECTQCNAKQYVYVDPTDHKWGTPVVEAEGDKAATCTEAGQKTKTCSECGKKEQVTIDALGHDLTGEDNPVQAKDATCTEAGMQLHWVCQRCGEYFADAAGNQGIDKDSVNIEALGHDYQKVDAIPPTCVETGVSEYWACSRCGVIDTENPEHTPKTILPVDSNAHVYSDLIGEREEPTCTEAGKYAYFQCTACKKYYKITATSDDGDTYEELTLQDGRVNEEDLVIPPTGHKWGAVTPKKPATCIDEGKEAYAKCTACNKYTKVTYAAEDTELANPQYDGKLFDDPEVEESIKIAALGHDWQKVEGTCTREAYYYCKTCEKLAKVISAAVGKDDELEGPIYLQYINSVTDVNKAGHHTWEPERTDYKAPTCEDTGNYGSVTCSECNATYKTTDDKGNLIENEANYVEVSNPDELVIAALGHDYGELIDEVPATCTDEGTAAHYKCSVCNKLFKNDENKTETDADGLVIPANGHKYGELIAEDKDRNVCTEPGMKDHYQCSECGKYFTDKNPQSEIEEGQLVIPAKGHQSETYIQAKDATCTTPGSTVGTRCSVCGVVLIAPTVIPALGHEFKEENYKTKTPATCEEKEIQEAKCSRCDVTQTREKPDSEPLGHDYQKVEAKEATCTEPGNIEHYKCSRCTKLFVDEEGGTKKEIPAEEVVTTKEHNYGELLAEVPATCTEEGTKAHYKCSECEKLFVDETTTQDDGTSVTTKKEVTADELVIEKIAHTVVVDEAVEATCTKIGYTEGSHCSVCNTVIKEQIVIPMKLHTPVTDEAVEATCTKTGLTEGKHCSVCGGTIVVQTVIPALGHNYKNGVCTRDGAKDPNYTAPTEPKSPSSGQNVAGSNSTTIKVMKITQAKVTKLKVKSKAKNTIKVTWNKVKGAKGYEIEVSKSSKFKVKAKLIKKTTKKLKLKIKNKKKFKSKKTYYVRVRAYTTYKAANGSTQTAYSNWNYVLRKVKVK